MIALMILPNNSSAYSHTEVIRIGAYDNGNIESRNLKSAVHDRWSGDVRRRWQLAKQSAVTMKRLRVLYCNMKGLSEPIETNRSFALVITAYNTSRRSIGYCIRHDVHHVKVRPAIPRTMA